MSTVLILFTILHVVGILIILSTDGKLDWFYKWFWKIWK